MGYDMIGKMGWREGGKDDIRRNIANPVTARQLIRTIGTARFWYLSEKYAETSVTVGMDGVNEWCFV